MASRYGAPRRAVTLTTSLVIAVGIALLMLGLLALERTGVGPVPDRLVPSERISKNTPQANKPNASNNSNGNHQKHCNNGKGRDAEKNKHCRQPSG